MIYIFLELKFLKNSLLNRSVLSEKVRPIFLCCAARGHALAIWLRLVPRRPNALRAGVINFFKKSYLQYSHLKSPQLSLQPCNNHNLQERKHPLDLACLF